MGLGLTFCITAGGRPDLLADTLQSLLAFNREAFDAILIANDVGDDETTTTARRLVPDATILHHPQRIGQHRTIDEIYARVETPFIFHCEDDWHFDPVPFVADAMALLEARPGASQVTLRQSGCHWNWDGAPGAHVDWTALGHWASFGFNPSVFRRQLWERVGPFAKYDREFDLNLAVQNLGLSSEVLVPGVCYHTGRGRHINDPERKRPTRLIRRWQRLQRKVRAFRNAG
ncbi:MAG: glycosyltransferase family A protein [Devosia sp.]